MASYADYSAEKLNECLAAIQDGMMSTRAAAVHFGIQRQTIMNTLKGHDASTPGRPAIFSDDEEKILSDCVIAMMDFLLMRLNYGKECVRSFLVRHPELTVHFAANIKISRAAINKQILYELYR
ncbi:hypothetical protein PR048_030391 [Dryococelus australis]|uniref:HTH psq-type domain-containing protein n=1 Tax=Dryococelus australis TaxID=614101 RepID=A0ABQ9G8V0_9NEOP|nr:hypothetical protein PR048_030391 [Dryococelus australis]